eukprot:33476-Pleurochrysis_carterae.AAC.4
MLVAVVRGKYRGKQHALQLAGTTARKDRAAVNAAASWSRRSSRCCPITERALAALNFVVLRDPDGADVRVTPKCRGTRDLPFLELKILNLAKCGKFEFTLFFS